jgi:hypothetical protein
MGHTSLTIGLRVSLTKSTNRAAVTLTAEITDGFQFSLPFRGRGKIY